MDFRGLKGERSRRYHENRSRSHHDLLVSFPLEGDRCPNKGYPFYWVDEPFRNSFTAWRSQEPTSTLTDVDNIIPEILLGEDDSWSVPAKQSRFVDAVKIEESSSSSVRS